MNQNSKIPESIKKSRVGFISKLSYIFDPDNIRKNEWNKIHGWYGKEGIVIYNKNKFAENIIPKFFKHRNMFSFLRQLNLYRFKKISSKNNLDHYCHPNFIINRKGNLNREMLVNIKRNVGVSIKKSSQLISENSNEDKIQIRKKRKLPLDEDISDDETVSSIYINNEKTNVKKSKRLAEKINYFEKLRENSVDELKSDISSLSTDSEDIFYTDESLLNKRNNSEDFFLEEINKDLYSEVYNESSYKFGCLESSYDNIDKEISEINFFDDNIELSSNCSINNILEFKKKY